MTRARLVFLYWMPAALWAAVVLSASTDLFSSQHSGVWINDFIIRIVGHPLPPRQFDILHFLIRKAAHLTEYFILGALTFRAIRADAEGWTVRWALVAVALATAVAAIDETHQMFVPSRTASVWDVMLDAVGATLAQTVAWFRGRADSA